MPLGKLPITAHSATRFAISGRERLVFAGCDYLGLSHHPALIEALVDAARIHGISSSGSRTTSGNRELYDQLERALADFLGVEDAVIAADGYIANLLAAQALAKRCSSAWVDTDAHVSITDGLRATRLRLRPYHDLAQLRSAIRSQPAENIVIATDGCFPAAAKLAQLSELLALLPNSSSALLVDDCHALGVLGTHGRGSLEHHALRDERILISGTFSKAIGCHGGFVAGAQQQIEAIRTQAHAYVGSTAFPAALAAAVLRALKLLDAPDSPLPHLRRNMERVRTDLSALGLPTHALPIPVFTLKLGSKERMHRIHEALYAQGLFIPLVEYPDQQGAYLRLAISAAHTDSDLEQLRDGLHSALLHCP